MGRFLWDLTIFNLSMIPFKLNINAQVGGFES